MGTSADHRAHREYLAEVQVEKAYAMMTQGRHREAIVHLQRTAQALPDTFQANFHFARALENLGHREKSRDVFARCLEISKANLDHAPEDRGAWSQMASSHLALKDFPSFTDALGEALARSDSDEVFVGLLGSFLKRIDDGRRALAVLDLLRERFGPVPSLLRHTAVRAAAIGEFDSATGLLESLVAADPDDLDTRYELGMLYLQDNVFAPQAVEHLGAVERERPDWPVLNGLGMAHMRLGAHKKAVAYFLRARRLADGGAHRVHSRIGKCHQLDGNPAAAAHAFDTALRLLDTACTASPDDPQLAAERVLTLARAGRTDDALDTYAAAIDRFLPAGDLRFPAGVYGPDGATSVPRLRDRMEGRTVAILCHGPSIAGLEGRIDRLAGRDDVVFASLHRWTVFDRFLDQIGRRTEVVCISNRRLLNPQWPFVREFLDHPDPSLLCMLRGDIDAFGRDGPGGSDFEDSYGGRVVYAEVPPNGLPMPNRPLMAGNCNSLSLLITLVAAGNPERILLFGADGGVPKEAAEAHYGLSDTSFHPFKEAREAVDVYKANYAYDASEFDHITRLNLFGIARLFGIAEPPVLNCSPDSAYRLFPRVTIDEGLESL